MPIETYTVVATGVYKAINSNDFTVGVYQWTAAVAGVDRRIGLNHISIVMLPLRLREVAIKRADYADADGRAQIKRIADGNGPFTNQNIV